MADSDKDVEVKLGAETGPLKSDVKEAAASIAASLKGIESALQNFGAQNKRVAEAAIKNNADLSRSFLELKGSVSGGFNAIAGVVERVRGVLASLTAVLAGGAAFSHAMSETNQFTGTVLNLARTMGIASDEATHLVVAIRSVGGDVDSYTGAYTRFERQLRMNGDVMKALGVDTDALKNGTKSSQQVFMDSIGILGQYKEGHDRLQVAMQLFGTRGVGEVNALLRLYEKGLEDAKKETEALGLTVTEQGIAMRQAYNESIEGVHLVLQGMSNAIADTVMPRLTELAEWFRSIGPAAVQVMREAMQVYSTVANSVGEVVRALWQTIKAAFGAARDLLVAVFGPGSASMDAMEFFRDVLKVIEIAIVGWKFAIVNALEVIKTGFQQLGFTFTLLKEVVDRALHFDFTGAKAAWDDYLSKVRTSAAALTATIVGNAKDAAEQIDTIVMRGAVAPTPGTPRRSPTGRTAPDFSPKAQPESRINEWDNELKAARDAYDHLKLEQGSFETWSLAQTEAYWATIKSRADLSAKERIDVENRWYDARRQILQRDFAAYMESLEAQKAALGHNIDAKIALQQKELDAAVQRYGQESAQAQAEYKKMGKLRQELADQRTAIAKVEEQAEEAAATHRMKTEDLIAQQQLALRQISAQQMYAIEQKLENDLYTLKRAGLQKRLADLRGDPTSDPVKAAEVASQIETLEQQHQERLTEIANKAELERKQYALQAAQSVQDAFANALEAISTRTKSLKDAVLDMVKSISTELAKLSAQSVAKSLLGPGTTGGGFLNSIFGNMFGGGTSTAAADTALVGFSTTTVATTATLTAFAAALTGATAAATTFAATSGASGLGTIAPLLSGIPSFDVGTPYVPRDTLAMVHKGEAVVPAQFNKAGRSGSGGNHYHTHININGQLDTRARDQIAAATFEGHRRAAYLNR